ncbi:hypothetical protein L917_03412, partial [Phytophthora nicotianae]
FLPTVPKTAARTHPLLEARSGVKPSCNRLVDFFSGVKQYINRIYAPHRSAKRQGTSREGACVTLNFLNDDIVLQQSPHERELAEPIASEDFVPSRGEESAVITDDLRRSMSRSNIRFLGKLFRSMRTKSPLLNDFIRLHLISRKFIEKVISQYHIVGVQETKFRDVHHLSKFQFICLQPPAIVYLSVTATAPAMFK